MKSLCDTICAMFSSATSEQFAFSRVNCSRPGTLARHRTMFNKGHSVRRGVVFAMASAGKKNRRSNGTTAPLFTHTTANLSFACRIWVCMYTRMSATVVTLAPQPIALYSRPLNLIDYTIYCWRIISFAAVGVQQQAADRHKFDFCVAMMLFFLFVRSTSNTQRAHVAATRGVAGATICLYYRIRDLAWLYTAHTLRRMT